MESKKKHTFLKKRCFITRNETEWNELVKIGFNKIILRAIKKTFITPCFMKLKNVKVYHDTKLFGDGKSSEKY